MKVESGDLIAIPAGERFGLGKVIYVSEYFKDVILIRLYKINYAMLDGLEFPSSEDQADLYYTSSDPVEKGHWKKVGSQALTEAEREMSKRVVGDHVWVGDEIISPASKEELKTLPKMLTYGYRLIEKAASRVP